MGWRSLETARFSQPRRAQGQAIAPSAALRRPTKNRSVMALEFVDRLFFRWRPFHRDMYGDCAVLALVYGNSGTEELTAW
jgi:hypothetical protein